MSICSFCGAEFEAMFTQMICGPTCPKFNEDKYNYVEPNSKYYTARRRAKMKKGDKIVALIVFEMYDWTCFVCGARIDPHRRTPDPMAATLEHAVPLSKNGQHTWSNVFPAHNLCNAIKGDELKELGIVVTERGIQFT